MLLSGGGHMNKSLLMSRSGVPHSCPLYDAHLETAGLHMTCMLYVISMAFPVTYLGKAAMGTGSWEGLRIRFKRRDHMLFALCQNAPTLSFKCLNSRYSTIGMIYVFRFTFLFQNNDNFDTKSVFSLVAQMVKNLPATWEIWVWSLGQEDPLEKELATYSSVLAWRIPWTEEPGGLQSTGSQRIGYNWMTNTHTEIP